MRICDVDSENNHRELRCIREQNINQGNHVCLDSEKDTKHLNEGKIHFPTNVTGTNK